MNIPKKQLLKQTRGNGGQPTPYVNIKSAGNKHSDMYTFKAQETTRVP